MSLPSPHPPPNPQKDVSRWGLMPRLDSFFYPLRGWGRELEGGGRGPRPLATSLNLTF